ncbi:MAG: hypothetical protein WBA89_21770 [Microcoleus sp.]
MSEVKSCSIGSMQCDRLDRDSDRFSRQSLAQGSKYIIPMPRKKI